MKNSFKIAIVAILAFGLLGCSKEKKDVKNILKKDGYEIRTITNGDNFNVYISKGSNGADVNQNSTEFIVVKEEDEYTVNFTFYDSAKSIRNNDKLTPYCLGVIYDSKNGKDGIDKTAEKQAESILEKLDIDADDLVDYAKEIVSASEE